MAHRWDPYFPSIPPLSSDPRTVRTSESDGTLSQNSENIAEHHDFSGTAASREAPVSHPNLNKNYCSSPSIENSRSDCAYERYCDTQWQDDKQLEKDYLERCESDFPNFATDRVPTSESFHSSYTSDFQGLKQNCEMLPTSCLEDYSSVSSCSDIDADEERPSCTFIGSDSFSKQKTEIPSKDSSAQLLSNDTENFNLQTKSKCPNMSENNTFSIKTCAGHAHSSTTSSMTTILRSETAHNRENFGDFQDIKQQEVVQRELKEGTHQDFLTTRNLAEDGIDQYPMDKEEDDQIKSTTSILLDNGQGFIDEKTLKETRNESAGSSNPVLSDDQDTTESENVQDKNQIQESLTKQSGSLDQKPFDEQKILTHNSTKSGEKIKKSDCPERNIQTNMSQTFDLLALKESSSELIEHELDECNLSSSSHDLESSLPEQQSFKSQIQDSSCTILAEIDYDCFKDATVANFAATYLQSNKSDSDLHTQKEMKKDEGFTTASGTKHDLDSCGSGITNSPSSSDEGKKNVASDMLSDIQTHSKGTDENSQIDKSAIASKSTEFSSDADCVSSTATNDITCENTNNENCQDAVPDEAPASEPYCSSPDIHSSIEMERTPLEKRSTNSSPDCLAPDVTSDCLTDDIIDKNSTSNPDSCLKLNVSGTNTQDCLKMGSPPKTEVLNLSSNQEGGPSATSNILSTESSLQSDDSNVDLHPSLSKDWTSHSKRASSSSQEDSKSDTLTDKPDDKIQSVSKDLGSCLQPNDSNADIQLCPEKELMHPGENTNSTSLSTHDELLHESFTAQEPLGSCDDFSDNARESFEKLDFSTQDQLEPGLLYGEPLSGEDSLCDMDETNLVSSQHEETVLKGPDEAGIGQLERPAPQLTSSVDMRRLLHPVVMLTTLESTNETSTSYCCADCKHTSHSVEHLIEHHYCNHPMFSFQYCKTCNVYQMKNELNEKHLCDTVSESPPLFPQKKKKTFGRHKCTKCGIIFSKIILYIRHMRTHTGKTPFRCKECGVYFAQSGCLQRHKSVPGRCKQSKLVDSNAEAVSKTETLPQKEERQNISNENMRRCYVKLIDISKTNLCHLCGKNFVSPRQVKKHMYYEHKRKRAALSSNESTTNDSSENPQNVTSEMHNKYKCPLCPRLFKYSYNRARHLRDCVRTAIHGGKNKVGDKFACPLCKATFTAVSNRYRHIKTNCLRDCLSRLSKEREHLQKKTKNELEPHSKEDVQITQLTEGEPKEQAPPVLIASKFGPLYKCNHCPAVFLNPSGKYRHMKKHELFKLTGKMFKYRNSVFSFMSKQETQDSTTENSNDQSETVKENLRHTQSCRFCGLGFILWATLKKHERSHRGERPYRCLECGKGFKKRSHLLGHKSVHQKKMQCTVCSETFQTVGELLQHRSSHLKRGKLQCPDCPAQYDYPAHLLRHLKRHKKIDKKPSQPEEVKPLLPQQSVEFVRDDKAPKQQQCSLCKKVFDDAHTLRKHSLTHISGSSSPQCPFCKKSFPERRYLLRHMTRHTGDKTFTCTNCGKQFYRTLYLKIHSQNCLPLHTNCHVETKPISKTNRRYLCSICPRSFCKRDRLQKHIYGHKKNILIACSRCGQYFGRTKIARHSAFCGETANISTDDKQANNAINCSSQTSMNIYKTPSHSKDSKIIQFKCPYCVQMFRYRSFFLRHLVKHTGVQPYACTRCGQRFKSQTLLFKHDTLCDGVNNAQQSKLKSEGEKKMDSFIEATQKHPPECEPEYKCKFCNKVFIKPRSLRRHILTHNEVKPYRCKACDSCFSRYDHLKVHHARCKGKKTRLEVRIPKISLDDVGRGWQTRVDVKPLDKQETFDCEVCLKSFPAQSKLSRHFTMFHTIKPFKCVRCGSGFSHEKSLKAHRKMRKCRKPSNETKAPPTQKSSQTTDNATKPLEEIRNRILLKIQPVVVKKFKHVCAYCPRSFKHSWQLNVHIRLHTGEKPYSCEYCEERFIRRDYLVRHYLKCSKKLERNKCNTCGGLYPDDEIEDHKNSCRLRPYACKYCGKKFSRRDRMFHHSLKCDKKLQSSNILCDRCGGFFSEDELEDHKKSCTSKPSSTPISKTQLSTPQSPPKGFSCAYCSSRFLLFSQLQEHFLSTHKVETLNPSVSTAPLQQLLSNLPNIKEEPVDESCEKKLDVNAICKLDTAPKSDNIPQYICQQCNMYFTNKAGLTGHQRVHATETPFKCKMCNRGFWNKTLLRNHFRKCRSSTDQHLDSPLKAEIEFALNDSDFEIKDSESTEALQTYKEESEDESSHSSFGNQVQSSSAEKKLVQYQCSECDKSFTDGLLLISHLEDHGREEQEKKQNICPKCGKICSSQGTLDKHMKMHEVNYKYPCANCSKAFSSISDLEKHKTSHDVSKPFSCKLCQQRFWTRPDVCGHYREEHADDALYCQFCSNVYVIKKSLIEHYKKRHAREWKELGSAMLTKGSTSEHQSSSHVSTTGESNDDDHIDNDEYDSDSDNDSDSAPYFPCHVCGKTFPTSESLEDHQLCHLGKKPHECAECGKCFVQASQLQQHQRMHKSEFQCQTCGRGFVTLFALRTHKHSHGKNRPHRCTKCDLSFTGPMQLAEHMSTHREENFPCDICNKVFQSKSSRAEHRKSHSKSERVNPSPSFLKGEHEQSESLFGYSSEFRYRCGICSERFRDPEELSEHGCMEAKERPYSCTNCSKHFLHSSHLKKHMNTHQPSWSDREYPCNQCNSSFSSPQNFMRHLESHVDAATGIESKGESSNGHICPVCHQCFASATELIHHFPTHPDNAPKRRRIKLNPSRSELKKLELLYPTSAAEYECTKCGGNFSGGNAFQRHYCYRQQQAIMESKYLNPTDASSTHQATVEEEEVDVTGEDLYTCNECSMPFSSKSSLLEHQNKLHSDGKPFKCDHCGKNFAKMRYLKKHENRHRLKELPINAAELLEKKFKCARCSAKFSTAHDLSAHMRLHAEKEVGEYRCDMCYKSFSKQALLRQHQESHVGEVVYECTECDKAFAFPHLLEEHQQTHAHAKPSE